MAQSGQNLNQEPPVRPTQVKSWLTAETMSPLGRALMEIAAEIETDDGAPMDEEAIERELIRRRGGHAQDGE
jgi:hypothetical protein